MILGRTIAAALCAGAAGLGVFALAAGDAWAFGGKKAASTDEVPETTAGTTGSAPAIGRASDEAALKSWCADLDAEVNRLGWTLPPCDWRRWKLGGTSVRGRPLVYAEFGNAQAEENTTLIFSMVHPDEITPLYVALQLVQWLGEHPQSLTEARVIVAPLVNPDGFYAERRTRTNANGVDVNRNFGTADWSREALQKWRKRFGGNPRRYPGTGPNSEPETRFQVRLIEEVQPHKVLSVHSPLNFMDYDGPMSIALKQFPKEYVHKCLELRSRVKAQHGGFFPGSLGNYAGQERGIPTLTLELPTADARHAHGYWERFKEGISTVIRFEVPAYVFREQGGDGGSVN
ncbi:MAG: DUF2817 domain-containing protein [Bdellovibrionales bacterium]|nr:DUF2817 domain-containing protein [Bdellovibrionales bacterium]